ncbi:MAG: putative holin [Gallionella sp.]|nr:putative holin [Gallionella sp.]MDD4947597.1 putative holin [Gallionella sp.]
MGLIGSFFSSLWAAPLYLAALFLTVALALSVGSFVLRRRGKPLPRLTGTILITLLLLLAVGLLAPQQLAVSLYKLSLLSMAGVAGYWLDIALFPYARPDTYLVNPDYRNARPVIGDANCPVVMGYRLTFAAAMLRRSIIVGAAMLTSALGA